MADWWRWTPSQTKTMQNTVRWPWSILYINLCSSSELTYFVMIILVHLRSKCPRIFYHSYWPRCTIQRKRVMYQNPIAYDLALLFILSISYQRNNLSGSNHQKRTSMKYQKEPPKKCFLSDVNVLLYLLIGNICRNFRKNLYSLVHIRFWDRSLEHLLIP